MIYVTQEVIVTSGVLLMPQLSNLLRRSHVPMKRFYNVQSTTLKLRG